MADTQVKSEITGTVWLIEAEAGAAVEKGSVLMILESMKMEIPVMAPTSGTLRRVNVAKGDPVIEGQVLAVIGG